MSTVNYFGLADIVRMPILAASYSNRNAVSVTGPSDPVKDSEPQKEITVELELYDSQMAAKHSLDDERRGRVSQLAWLSRLLCNVAWASRSSVRLLT
jgi:hypothetical protein